MPQVLSVHAREVGTNPSDPTGLRRSQRAVVDAVRHHNVIVFHAPTGAGKTHVLREISAENATSSKPKRVVVAFPAVALVTQQSAELSAKNLESWDGIYEQLVARAKANPEGKAAQQLRSFERNFHVPDDLRRSFLTQRLFEADRLAPIAMTMDSLFLMVKGLVAASAPSITKSAIRSILTNYFQRAPRHVLESKVKEVHATLNPTSNIGLGTRKRLCHKVSSWTFLTQDVCDRIVGDLMAEALPEDLTPGPKYHYTKRDAARLMAEFRGALVVFDEYHLMAQWQASRRLIGWLLRLGARILLLSGTPRTDFIAPWDPKVIDFDTEEDLTRIAQGEPTITFNHPLKVEIRCDRFRQSSSGYSPNSLALHYIHQWDREAPGPCVLVYESVDRAHSVLHTLQGTPGLRERVMIWTGPEKSKDLRQILRGEARLAPDAIVVGTAALEVGIDLPFRNLFSEVLYNQSLMQRVGRVGRMGTVAPGETHNVVISLNKSFLPEALLPQDAIERRDLAEVMLHIVGRDARPDDEYEGLWLRGSRTAQFLAIVCKNGEWRALRGSASLLKVFPPDGSTLSEWWFLKPPQRRDLIVSLGVPDDTSTAAIWSELQGSSYAAYISTNQPQQAGVLEHHDKPIDSARMRRTWTLRSYSNLNKSTILWAIVPLPKNNKAKKENVA